MLITMSQGWQEEISITFQLLTRGFGVLHSCEDQCVDAPEKTVCLETQW
jgi:hypothetical protein